MFGEKCPICKQELKNIKNKPKATMEDHLMSHTKIEIVRLALESQK